jgi:hypothetical protein
MKGFFKPAIATFMLALAGNAQAYIQAYTVSEVFSDGTKNGATFKGSFDFDTATEQLTNLSGVLKDANGTQNLGVDWYAINGQVGGQAYVSNATYELAVKNISSASKLFVGIVVNNAIPTLDTFNSMYSDNVGSKTLNGTEVSATITAVVPLPSALPLLASGLLGLRLVVRKR